MTPRFADPIAWQQAELLMQPAFIRVIDNIRKQLEQSSWKGTYRDVKIWAEDVSAETQNQVIQLQQQLAEADPEQAAVIEKTLAQLPQSYPGYELCLEHQGQQITVDLWRLCYEVCFDRYTPAMESGEAAIAIDASLIDETGDVDWQRLDDKAKHLVERIFTELSS